MTYWQEILAEKKQQMTAAEINKKGAAALKDEQKKNKEEKKAKQKDPNQPSQADWYALKKARFEHQKQQEIERRKREPRERAAAALQGIKTEPISSQDKEGTAYSKLIGNIGSAAGGLAGAAYHGARALGKKTSKQPEMRERQAVGRPKGTAPTPVAAPTPSSAPQRERGGAIVKSPSGALVKPSVPISKRKRLPPSSQGGTRVGQPARTIGQPAPQRPGLPMGVNKRKMLPGSTQGGTQIGKPATQPTLGQKARASQKVRAGLIQQRMGEEFSNWREEFLWEVEDKKYSKEKQKTIDIMRGKNKIEVNPTTGDKNSINPMTGMHETYDNEMFRQHSQERPLRSSETTPGRRTSTSSLVKKMRELNISTPAAKKKKKKSKVSEEVTIEDASGVTFAQIIDIIGPRQMQPIVREGRWKGYNQVVANEEVVMEASPAWQRKEGKNPEGGLNKAGIASYRREHPGSKLSLAVTEKPSKLKKGSKKWKRRKSFCARMSGMPGPMKDEKGRPTRKALSLRKWNC